MTYKYKQRGFTHIIMLVIFLVVIIGGLIFIALNKSPKKAVLPGLTDSKELNQKTDQAQGLSYESGLRLQPSDFGVTAGLPVADVSAVKLIDGSWRIYAFAQNKGIVSAISKDGLTFTAENGTRLGDGAGMPRIFKLDDGRYRLYFIDAGGISSAISNDGLSFIKEPGKRITAPSGVKDISGISTPIKLNDNKWHVYFSDLPRPGDGVKPHLIHSATSSDLLTWQLDEGYRIGGEKLSTSAEHPDAILNEDGKVLLYYFVNQGKKLMTATSSDGLTFINPQETGLDCNDPNIVSLGTDSYRLYCGDFNQSIGGIVKSAKITRLPNYP